MAGAKVPLTFRLFKGDQFLREEKLTLPVIKVGKLSSSHLRLDDESVSRMHAVIEVTGPGDVSIIDLGSTKGTFVNGQKVNKAKLQSGDTVVVGDTRIEVAIGGADEAEEDIPTRVQAGPAPSESGNVIASTPRPAAPLPPAPMSMPSAAPPPIAPPAAPTMMAPPPPPAAPSYASAPTMVAPPMPSMSAPPPAGLRPPPGMPAPYGMQPMSTGAPAAFAAAAAAEAEVPGARAVEIAAMLGDSVVAVKHCMDPKSGKVTAATYGLFAGGAAMLVMAAFSFVTSVHHATVNESRKEACMKGDPKASPPRPARPDYYCDHDPSPMSLGFDWMAFAGLFLGVLGTSWGLIRYREEKRSPFFRIGQDPGVEFTTAVSPSSSFALVAPRGDDFVFNYAQGMDGEMIVGDQSTPLAQVQAQPSSTQPGAMELMIPQKARIRVRAGQATFLISSVPQPRRQIAPLFASMESRVLTYFAGSAAVHLGLWLLLRTIPPDPENTSGDIAGNEDVTTHSTAISQEDPLQVQPDQKDDGEDESGGTGTAMMLDEGKMGKKDYQGADHQYNMKKNLDQEQLARANAIEEAKHEGILGSNSALQGAVFSSITGTGDISSGLEDQDIQGGLTGDEPGEATGGFGFGRSGFGAGGGGTGIGTIGTGNYGTIGHGSGTGTGYGIGGGRGGMHGRTAAVPQVHIGQPSAVGDLDKAIIRRYIKRNINKIQYCYEKELLAKPGLKGTVSTQFFISPNGTVPQASASGVDGSVSSCVADVLKGIEFPKPKGGGGVQVNYPFVFEATGGG